MRGGPPRFVVRTTVATLAMVACLLSAVLLTVLVETHARVRESVSEKLDAGRRMLAALEERRAHEQQQEIATLAESPTLKAAVDTYQAELGSSDPVTRRQLVTTVSRELEKLADRLHPDVIAVMDAGGQTLAVAGRDRAGWKSQAPGEVLEAGSSWVRLPGGLFRVATADLVVQGSVLGSIRIATALDVEYARELSELSGASTLVAFGDEVMVTTLPEASRADLTGEVILRLPGLDILSLDGTEYAVREIARAGPAGVYVLESIDAAMAPAAGRAARGLLIIAVAAFGLAGIASVWLSRTIARPIGRLSASIDAMTRAGSRDRELPFTGASQEVDTLTAAFNTMMRSLGAAEAETRSAYVGAIRALAVALDARDPYTAGHSERVSAISVAVGRQMQLPDEDLEILRLGALLHDIGKIGISDAVLRKPGALTDEEFEVIKTHPAVGARILRSVSFLAPHIPIVELHHERPDGRGYPLGLGGDQIPPPARIVHVADAFDAMTSARAYRQGRPAADALRELWRCAGSQFDAEVVQALASILPALEGLLPDAGETYEVVARAPRLALAHQGARA
jgi:putative nucleotidyltransferase with HDIG domain